MSNLVAEKQAFGRGRKGGMGKGGGGSRTPREAPDNLLNDSTLYAIHVVSEGEIGGWADVANPGKCIFFDGTPLQNDDLSFNFEDVSYWLRTGTPDQDPVPGFSAIEAETTLGLKVEQALPVTRQITDADVDAVRVKVGVNALSHLDADTGDVNETRVEYRIEMQVGAGSFTSVVSSAFDGKTTSGYQRAHRIELPDMRPINLRVVRVTADSEQSALQNDIYYVSVTEIIDAKLRYSDTAYVALALPASVFGGSLPTVTFRLRGMLCWVPSNYDPSTRAYDEGTMWDGTFVQAFTDNPAFFGYTVYVEDRWGLGDRIPPALVDKWSVYQIGKYCDGLVDDGLGGTEPRMTINGVINARQAAFEVVTRISSVWRGATFWGAGAVVPVQDAPVDATRLVANANVKGGRFRYSSTGLDARKTVAIAAYRHTDDHYKIKAGAIFEHQAGVRRFGYRDIDMQLPFCASRGEALRTVRWHIDTAMTATQTVSYEAGFDHARIRPFDVVKIADKHKVFTRTMGRLAVVLVNRLGVTLDAAVELVDGESYTVLLTDDLGEIVEAIVTTPATGSTLTLDFASAIPANINPGAVFALNATGVAPREFRVLSNEPKGHLFAITALEHDAGKYARVEDDLQAENTEPFIAPSRGAPLAPASCDVAVFLKPDPGSTSKLRLLASWPGHPDARVVEHRAQVKEPGKPWRWVGGSHEASLEIAPEREVAGLYEVRLFAVTMDGKLSGSYASGSVTHTAADFPRPIPPVPWTAEAGHDMITLVGTTHPASDIRAHRIYGATATDPTLVPLDEIDGTVYPRRPPAGDPYTRYKVTAISYAERESDPDGSPFIAAVPSGVPLADLNQDIVDAIDDAAQSAEADKQAAEQAASDAQAAHGLAETARVASQAARDAGQTAQGLAETARDAAAASESASAGSASAAAGSATTAATEASDAVASATAAAADSVAAETARSGAVAAENAAAASSTSAAGSAASATSSATLSAEIADQASGVLSSQFLEVQYGSKWTDLHWAIGPTVVANEVFGQGNTLVFDVVTAEDAGVFINSDFAIWTGAANLDEYTIDIAFELVSGSISGARVLFDWRNDVSATYRFTVDLDDLVSGGVQTGVLYHRSFIVRRPADYSGTFGEHKVYLMVNNWPKALKQIKLHRCYIRPTSADVGAAEASAAAALSSEGNAAAHETAAGSHAAAAQSDAATASTERAAAEAAQVAAASSETGAAGSAAAAATSETLAAAAETAAGQSADAAAVDAASASASETAAGQDASAAALDRVAAETAEAGAVAAQVAAASSETGAAGSAAAALASEQLSAQVVGEGGGVLRSQYFAYENGVDWTEWVTAPTLLANQVYSLGNSLEWDVDEDTDAGIQILSTWAGWTGLADADVWSFDFELTLLSGSPDGLLVLVDWMNTEGTMRRAVADLRFMSDFPPGELVRISASLPRPDTFTGTVQFCRVYLMANYYDRSAKRVQFHRFHLRPQDHDATLAETAAANAAISETNSATAKIGAEAAEASAVAAKTAAAKFLQGGASNPVFAAWDATWPDDWAVETGPPSSVTKVPGKYGNAIEFAIASGGPVFQPYIHQYRVNEHSLGVGDASRLTKALITFEVELTAGTSWGGAFVRLEYIAGNGTFTTHVYFKDVCHTDLNAVQKVDVFVDRPSGYVSGGDERVDLRLYWTHSGVDPGTVLTARLHSLSVQDASASSEAAILQFAHAQASGMNGAGIVFRTQAGSGGTVLELVSASDPEAGEVHTGRFRGDEFIFESSVTADELAANSVTTDALAANSVTAGALAANSVTANAIGPGAVGITEASGVWQSPNFSSGNNGLQVNWANGDVELNNLIVRGDMIEDNAIVEAGSRTTSGTSNATNGVTMVTMPTLGVDGGVLLFGSAEIRGNNDADLNFFVDLRRGSSTVATVGVANPGAGSTGGNPQWGGVSISTLDLPSSGNHSYNLRLRWSKTSTSGVMPAMRSRKLSGIDFKQM